MYVACSSETFLLIYQSRERDSVAGDSGLLGRYAVPIDSYRHFEEP